MNDFSGKIAGWSSADSRLRAVAGDANGFNFDLPDGSVATVAVAAAAPFLTLRVGLPLSGASKTSLAQSEVRSGVDAFVRGVLLSRSSLSIATIDAAAGVLSIEVRMHEEGVSGHVFLTSVNELIRLAEILSSGIAESAEAIPQLLESQAQFEQSKQELLQLEEESRRAALEQSAYEVELQRKQEAAAAEDAAAEAARAAVLNTAVPGAPNVPGVPPVPASADAPPAEAAAPAVEAAAATSATSACRSCGAQIAIGQRFCVSCGTPVA
jgi:hypothetical protein